MSAPQNPSCKPNKYNHYHRQRQAPSLSQSSDAMAAAQHTNNSSTYTRLSSHSKDDDNDNNKKPFAMIDLPKIRSRIKSALHQVKINFQQIKKDLRPRTADITYWATVKSDSGVTVKYSRRISRMMVKSRQHNVQISEVTEWLREQDERCRERGSTGTKLVVGWYTVDGRGVVEKEVEWMVEQEDRDLGNWEGERVWWVIREDETRERVRPAREVQREVEMGRRERAVERRRVMKRDRSLEKRTGVELQRATRRMSLD